MDQPKRKYKKHKTDYKIGITYFADERLKPNLFNGEKIYPVYISVRVKKQITTIRSRLHFYSAQEKISQDLLSPLLAPYIEKEKASIEKSLRNLSPDTNESFKISNWLPYYQLGLVDLRQVVLNGLANKFFNLLYNDLKLPEEILEPYVSSINSDIIDWHTLEMIELQLHVLNRLGNNKAKELLDEFKFLADTSIYRKDIDNPFQLSNPFQIYNYNHCLWDLITDNYSLVDTDYDKASSSYQPSEIYTRVSNIVTDTLTYQSIFEGLITST